MRDRIDNLMEMLGMSATQFAQTVGIQRSTLQHILNGRNEPSLNVVKSIHDALPDVNLEWLLYGNGNPFKSNKDVNDDDYPLFRNVENSVFRTDAGPEAEFSSHEAIQTCLNRERRKRSRRKPFATI